MPVGAGGFCVFLTRKSTSTSTNRRFVRSLLWPPAKDFAKQRRFVRRFVRSLGEAHTSDWALGFAQSPLPSAQQSKGDL